MLVTRNVVTRDEVIAAIKELAGKLGRSPRYPEAIRVVNVTRRQIQRMFGGWAGALEESGCERLRTGGTEAPMHDLFEDWVAVARKAGRVPSIQQYEKLSRYSVRPLKDRVGAWQKIPGALLQYGEARQLWAGNEDVKEMIERRMDDRAIMPQSTQNRRSPQNAQDRRILGTPLFCPSKPEPGLPGAPQNGQQGRGVGVQTSRPAAIDVHTRHGARKTAVPEVIDAEMLYGEPLVLGPMGTAPENEMGVVYLFGTMARELGFVVMRIRPGFPDCEALRRLGNGRWQRVRIEFEFESRNFVTHGHDQKGCDLIVCWTDNWQGCPVEVIELKGAFSTRSEAFSTQQSAFSPYTVSKPVGRTEKL